MPTPVSALADRPSALDPEGTGAERIADLWWIMLGAGTVVWVVVVAPAPPAMTRLLRDPMTSNEGGSMSSRRLTALVAAVALSATGLAACGDDEEDTAAPPPPPAPTQTEPPADEQPAGATVDVAADPGGGLDYVQDSLTAQAGSVTFAFTNEASVPHDLNIEQDGERIAGTEVITQSEEDLTVDLEPGEYTYYCSVANHREEGMEGELTVE